MKSRNKKKAKSIFERGDKTSNQSLRKKTLPYIPPNVDVYYVTLESGIAAASAQVKNSQGDVKEDWGDENNYNNDINFTN
ncbi:MAG: hypothetical protein H6Q14_582 [Bacteroidetes bacterium]|jgi:hypothetical protein|nr:hypothetical protein [Bacteroidota bacterium]